MAINWDTLVIGPTIAAFGEPVIYHSQNGLLAITGIFDEAYLELTPLGRGGVASEGMALGYPGSITTEMPVLGVQLSQFPPTMQPAQADAIEARGAWYSVKEVRIDSHGWAKLLLNEIQTPQ